MCSLKSSVITSLLYFSVLILLPIIFLFFLPFIIWRRFVSFLGQNFGGHSLGKILTVSSTSHACSEGRGTCVLPFIVRGLPNLEHIKDQFTKNILNAKNPNKEGQLLYPELRQAVVSWGGYLFWKNIPNYQLPIRLLEVEPVDLTSPEGLKLLLTLYNCQWKFWVEPLWELLIIPGLDGMFGIVWVVHHTLTDGSSWQQLIDKISDPSIIGEKGRAISRSTPYPILMIRTLFRLPYDVAKYLKLVIHQKLATRAKSVSVCNANKEKTINSSTPRKQLTQASTYFHLPGLKKIAATQGVSINALLLSGAQASLQKEWEGSHIIYFTIPVPKHTEKLRNVGGTGYVVTLNKGEGPQARLRDVEAQLQNYKFSAFPSFSTIMGTFFGSLPPFLLRRTMNGAAGSLTFVLSTFVCSRHPFSIFGYPVIKLGAMGSGHSGSKVVAIFAFTIGDTMSFAVMGDKGVVNEERGKALVQGVVDEFEALKNLNVLNHISVAMHEP